MHQFTMMAALKSSTLLALVSILVVSHWDSKKESLLMGLEEDELFWGRTLVGGSFIACPCRINVCG